MSRIIALEFTGGFKIGQLAIEAATGSRWAHVRGLSNVKTCIDATAKYGVKEHNPAEGGYIWNDVVLLDFLSIAQQRRLYKLVKAEEGKGYDWGWILGLPLGRNWDSSNRWVCSELWASKLSSLGVFRKIDQHRITPAQLRKAVKQYRLLGVHANG